MGTFWRIFGEATRELGSSTQQAQRLTNLVLDVQKLQDVVDAHGNLVANDKPQADWRDLPDFWITFREYDVCT
jgi:hypothetical protein